MDDTPVAVFLGAVGSTTVQYILTDHLNTPRAVVNSSNTIVWRWDITPTVFGEHAVDSDPDNNGSGYTLNLRYPGQYYDADTGLHQNYFRDYDPGTGRYFQSDPIGLGGGPSTFAYVGARPFSETDPHGLLTNVVPWWLYPVAAPVSPWLVAGLGGASAALYINQGYEKQRGVPLGVDLHLTFDTTPAFGTVGCERYASQQCVLAIAQYNERLKQRELRPRDCPRGVRGIDQTGLTTEEIHRIKRALGAQPKDWVGIGEDGTIWTNEDGEAADQGNTSDHDVNNE